MTGSLVDRNVAVIVAAGDTSRTGSEGCNGNPGRAPAINSFGGSAAMQLALDSLRLGIDAAIGGIPPQPRLATVARRGMTALI
jgi:hypothetical protein